MKKLLLAVLFPSIAFSTELTPKCFLYDGDKFADFSVKTVYSEVVNPPLIARTYDGFQEFSLMEKKYRVEVIIHAARSNKDGFRGTQIKLIELDSDGKSVWSMSSDSMFGKEETGIGLPVTFGTTYYISLKEFLQLKCSLSN